VEGRVYFAENRMVYQELPHGRGLAYSDEFLAAEIFLCTRDEGCPGCDREVFPRQYAKLMYFVF
jgi:hypothetical protein